MNEDQSTRAVERARRCAKSDNQAKAIEDLLSDTGMTTHIPTALGLDPRYHRRPQYLRSNQQSWDNLRKRLEATGLAVAEVVSANGEHRFKLVLDPMTATLVRDGLSLDIATAAVEYLTDRIGERVDLTS